MFSSDVRLSVLLTLIFLLPGVSMAKLKSFRDWKSERISESQLKIQTFKSQIEQRKKELVNKKADTQTDVTLINLEQKLQLEQFSFDLATDLSVTDYFVGYLNKVENKQSAFKELAAKMSPDEVAEIMTAYANSVFGTRESSEKADLPPSASNLKNLNCSP